MEFINVLTKNNGIDCYGGDYNGDYSDDFNGLKVVFRKIVRRKI